jgi:hypothetical protein
MEGVECESEGEGECKQGRVSRRSTTHVTVEVTPPKRGRFNSKTTLLLREVVLRLK